MAPPVSKKEIERIRRSLDLASVIRSRGVSLSPKGRNLVGCCPFHDDRTPSLVVSPDKQLWNCFGACSAGNGKSGGDVIAFVMKADGLSFLEAVHRLNGNGKAGAVTTARPEREPRCSVPSPSDLLGRVVEHYHQAFREHPEAQNYLARRGLSDPEMLSAFKVGYADGGLLKTIDSEGDVAGGLRGAGVINDRRREHLLGCIVFPLSLPDIGVVGLYGRHINRDRHLYLPGPRRGVFHWQAMKGASEVVLTESILDALTLYQAGFRNVSAVYGTQGFAADHAELLQRFRVRRVLLCLDNDKAGDQATEAIAAKIRALGIHVDDARVQGAKDPNDVFLSLGPERASGLYRARFRELSNAGSPHSSDTASASPLAAPTEVREAAPEPYSADEPGGAACPDSGPSVTPEAGGGWLIGFGERSYRVRGLTPTGLDRLKVNLRIQAGNRFHLDNLDLYSHRSRSALIQELLRLFGVVREELLPEINTLIDTLENIRLDLAKRGEDAGGPARVEISERDREEALRMLRAPDLLERVLADFEPAGFVGEHTALTLGYLGTVSRLLDDPLAVLIISRSGAGKSFLQDALCDFVPEESLAKYTRLTGQALFYKAEDSLRHKVLAIAEETGAEDAAYSIRTLQSAQSLTIAATGTDPSTGKLRTQEYRVHGPVFIMLTTTSPEALDEETRSRFVHVGIDESKEQTRRILARQREADTLDGVVRRAEVESIRWRHHNLQRLLRPLKVVNPYASRLTYPDERLQMRREQKKYLTLIKAIALLHQHQREIKRARRGEVEIEYVEVVPADIALANRLAREVLGRSLDELAHPTRELLKHLVEMVGETGSGARQFTRRDVKDATGWSDWQVRTYLEELVQMEYVEIVSGSRGKRLTYELVFDGAPEEDRHYLAGLLDVEAVVETPEGRSR
jgi:DNA primase catalytic core